MTRKKNKFARIHTMKDLEWALESVKSDQKRLGAEIETDLKIKRESLKPSNLALNALHSLTPFDSWADLSLGVVRGLKNVLTPSEETKAAWLDKKAEKKALKAVEKEEKKEERKVEKALKAVEKEEKKEEKKAEKAAKKVEKEIKKKEKEAPAEVVEIVEVVETVESAEPEAAEK